jgi:curved DNA-binding protein CbpA
MDVKEALKILSLSSNFTKERLRKRYLRLVKKYHPDLHPENLRKKYTLKLREINEAYKLLLSFLEKGESSQQRKEKRGNITRVQSLKRWRLR